MKLPEVQHTGSVVVIEFDSVSHVIDIAAARGFGRNQHNILRADNALASQGNEWRNGATVKLLREWIVDAPARLRDAVDEARAAIEDAIEAPTRKTRKLRRNRDDGDEMDAQAHAMRSPTPWIEVEHRSTPKHTITIVVNTAISCNMQPEHLVWRGAAAAAAADVLSTMGHSVEVLAISASIGTAVNAERLMSVVPAKRADSPLDVSSLAVAIAEIGYFRLAVLGAWQRVLPGRCFLGLGCPRTVDAVEAKADLVMDAGIFDKQTAIAAVLHAIGSARRAEEESHGKAF